MKKLLGLATFSTVAISGLFASAAYANTYSLHDNQTGRDYTCSAGGSGGPVDPACVPEVRTFCNSLTSQTRDVCYTRATQACARGVRVGCVPTIAQDCDANTSFTRDRCFDEAIAACGGNVAAIQNLIQGTRNQGLLEILRKQESQTV